MSADKLPWIPFDACDWLAEVRELSFEARGVLIELRALQWDRGLLPADPKKLARLVGMSATRFTGVWTSIGSKFQQVPGGLLDVRLHALRVEKFEAARARRDQAKHAAGRRWNGSGNARSNPDGNAYSDSDPDPDPDPESQTDSSESGFEAEWVGEVDAATEYVEPKADSPRKFLTEDWYPSPEAIKAVQRPDCLLEGLIAAFRAWAISGGHRSTNWDAAFRKFCKRHRPSDEQRIRAKVADKLLANSVMSGIRDQLVHSSVTESLVIDSKFQRRTSQAQSWIGHVLGDQPKHDSLTARVLAGQPHVGERDASTSI